MNNQSNSHRSREMANEEREIRPVTHGQTVIKKDTVGKKFADVFLAENMSNVKDYIIFDVLVPAVNDTIVNMLTSGVSMLFKGQPGSYNRGSGRSRLNERTSYSSYYGRSSDNREKPAERRYERPTRSTNGYIEIGFTELGDAKEVRQEIYNIIQDDKYPYVSVQEYYALSDHADLAEYTDTRRGWYADDLRRIEISRCYDGLYRLDLPRPEHFD